MKNLSKLFFLFSFLFAGTFSYAQDADLPDVDKLLTSYYEAIGGADAWKSKKSMKMTGNSENMGMTFPVTVLSMRPNMQKVEVNVQGQQIVEAFDGESAWAINPFMGSTEPTKKTDAESKEAAKNVFEDDLIDWKAKGHSVAIDGTEEVDGVETIKVKLTRKEGDEREYFFDPEYSIPIMMRVFIDAGPMKGKAIDTYLSDYNEVDGLMVPFSIEQKVDGQTMMKMKAEKIEFDVDVSEDTFTMPEK